MKSIEESHRIAFERIESFLPDNTVRLPEFVVPAGFTATQALVNFALEGLKDKGLHTNKEYTDRLRQELNVIDDRGFSKYFLTMKSIVDVATDMMLTGPGRGSAAGSLVAYALNITQVDPIKYDLLFSRFLRSDAKDYPDIDYDVSDSMALKEISAELRPELCRYHPELISGMLLSRSSAVKTHVEGLVGQVRSCSRHAGGVVIAEDLDKSMPLINSGGVRQAPWAEGQNVRHLEPMGFIKFDLLGLSTLKMMEGAIYHILKRHHGVEEPTFAQIRDYYEKNLHPDVLDMNDSAIYENIFHTGKWAGIFQFTENGAQQFCVRAKPDNIIDVSAITSIFRPGPLSAGVDGDYVEAKGHPQRISYLSEEAREISAELRPELCRYQPSGTSLNTSQDMVSTSHTPCHTLLFHTNVLGCGTITQQSGWLHSWTRSLRHVRRRPSTSPSNMDSTLHPWMSTSLAQSGRSAKMARL